MNKKVEVLTQHYAAALENYLQAGQAELPPALDLGRRTVTLGLELLDLARIHENALVRLKLGGGKSRDKKRAEVFFLEAVIPIVETHRAARQSKDDLRRLKGLLISRTAELAVTNRQLQRGIARSGSVEAASKKRGKDDARLLKASLQLQEGLRQLTHRVLRGQEEERLKISLELQTEIAQTLISINLRLLALKHEASSKTRGLNCKIADTRRWVEKSAGFIRRAAGRL